VHASSLPISSDLKAFCGQYGFDAVEWALSGGEDYALLFTVRPQGLSALKREYERKFDRPIAVIGEMIQGQSLVWVDDFGQERYLEASGWNHFTKK
jgi:thiamine-monophosphate kinase